ncbi:MAG: hypothetical protein EOO86_08800 [Pedobacter sp.]|nr:MAG: hypothetical protein EOO86_08800 [Pedobacter sp.]
MRKISILVIFVFSLFSCKQKSVVHPTFYFWKTDYHHHKAETAYLNKFKSKSLYVRIMDVDFNPDFQQDVPVSPIKFSDPLPPQVDIIPVVFLVNRIFNEIDSNRTKLLADHIAVFVEAKVKQSSTEIWKSKLYSRSTRNGYLFKRLFGKLPLET